MNYLKPFLLLTVCTITATSTASAAPYVRGDAPTYRCAYQTNTVRKALMYQAKKMLLNNCPGCKFLAVSAKITEPESVAISKVDSSVILPYSALERVGVVPSVSNSPSPSGTPSVPFGTGIGVKLNAASELPVCEATSVPAYVYISYREPGATRRTVKRVWSKMTLRGTLRAD